MDSKNDDSSIGSDSLDKSLLQKCQVGDVQKEQVISQDSLENTTEKDVNVLEPSQQPQQKTENYSNSEGINAAATEARVSSLHFFKPSSTIRGTFCRVLDSDDDSDDADTYPSSYNKPTSGNITISTPPETIKSTTTTRSSIQQKPSNTFETKVSQISENLKETKLETTTQSSLLGAPSSSSSSQIETAATSSQSILVGNSASAIKRNTKKALIEELPGPSVFTSKGAYSGNSKLHVDHDSTSFQTETDCIDDPMDHRSKKVRFHPDAKANDGGIRVVPKKKKKLKSTAANPSTIPQCEEQTEEDEMEIDLDKIAAMAEKYLEEHPLTFIPSNPEFRHLPPFNNPLPFGLMFEDDEEEIEQEVAEKVEDDLKANVQTDKVKNDELTAEKEPPKISPTTDEEMQDIVIEAENGVEYILGKTTVNDEESYLLRLVENGDLLWKSKDYVQKQCPNLLHKYEENLLLQEERLLEYLNDRQNYRQRYTDF